MTDLILTDEEIRQLTKKKRFSAQIRHLKEILKGTSAEVRLAPDGAPIVSRKAFEQAMGYSPEPTPKENEVKLHLDFLKKKP